MAKAKAKPKGKAPVKRAATSRGARTAELRRRRERRSLRNRLIAAGLVLVATGALIFYNVTRDEAPPVGSVSCTADTKHDREGTPIHIENPTYEVSPPAGGSHTPTAAQPGFYRPGNPVPSDGELVHAMEHGFVVLWYQPDLGADDIAKIERISDKRGRELIAVPRRSLGGPVALTAWHHRLLCSAIDVDAAIQFSERYRDKGPESGFL